MENKYTLIAAPIYSKHSDIIEMESEELKRLCKEKRIPLFTLKVDNIINAFGYAENPKQPYLKYFAFLQGVWFTAKEKTEETPGAQ